VKVWVVEQGEYADRWVEGVYANLDAAMAVHAKQGNWRSSEDKTHWWNDLPDVEAKSIKQFDLEGPVFAPR
jgi:hypothetical protein